MLLLRPSVSGQTVISTINTSTSTGTTTTTLVTSPSDAGNSILANTQYNINYGQGNNVGVSSYVVSGTTYDRFLAPDTVILLRRVTNDRLVNIWYQLNQINTTPNPDELDIDPDIVAEADAIYLSGNLNAGYDNILVNDDDLASGSIEVETERVDVIWYSGIQSSSPTTSVFPIIERGGNDNIVIAPITSLDSNGDPATYGTAVGIGENFWPGSGQTFSQYLILRRQAVGDDPIPLIEIGSQVVQGVAVSFSEMGISAGQSIFGYSLFAADVVSGYTQGSTLTSGTVTIAGGVSLDDITTFPSNTLSSDSGLDLVAGVSAAVASDDNLIETVGPGGYKDALRTWLKANDGAFVTSGGAASTEGTNVGFWEDQSAGNHDYTTSGTAPTFRSSTSSINFNPTVDFVENAERALATANNADYNDKVSNTGFLSKGINIAFRTNANDITTKQQLFEEGGGTNGLGIYIRAGNLHLSVWNRGAQAQGDWNDDASGVETVSTSLALDTEYIVTLEFDGDDSGSKNGTITGYLNGQSFGVLSDPFSQGVGLLYDHTGGIELGDSDGSRYDDGGTSATSFEGEIAEFIYCNEPASFPLAQRQRIESYLAIKYGITLDQSTPINYVNSDGTIIFNTTQNASLGGFLEYNNDIAGIGRDDDSELDQPASKSENAGSVVTIDRGATISTDDTWLIWGNDGGALTESSSVSSPSNIDTRLERVWRVAERNEVQTTSVSFDLTGLGLSTDAADFSLLVASNSSNADFSNATVLTGGTFNGNVITFTGVDLDDAQYFTLGTAFFFCTPGRYNDGIQTWLRADEGVTTATEGANVTLWADQTPTGNNGTNLTAPVYRATTNLINDNPTIDFSTGSTGLALPTIAGLNSGESLSKKFTIAFKTGDITPTTKQVIYEQGGATRGLNVYIESSTLHISGWNQASDGTGAPWNTAGAITTVNTTSIASNTTYVLTFDYAGNDAITGNITGYLNGQSFGTPLANVGRLYSHTDAIGLGDENSASRYDDGTTSGALSFDGFISEISYYDSPSSYLATDRNRIETSMAIKYGITLDQTSATNYTRSDATTIWDATTNATYNNDIAGIGRDDDACLDQKQSQSENAGSIVKMGLNTIEANNASNSNTFDDDGDFLVWGNDGDFADQANANTSDLPGSVTERMERIWKVDDTGLVGATEISFDLTGLGYGTNLTDFQLIVSNSSTMASGTTIPAASYDVGTNTVTFTGVDLTDGQFFTLGTGRDQCGPGGVTADLELWLRADLQVFNTGTTQATDGQTVATWADQSLSGADATDPSNLTTFETNTVNFNPAIEFNNDATSLEGTITTTAAGLSFITAGFINSSSGTDDALFEFRGGTSDDRSFLINSRYGGNTAYSSNFNEDAWNIWSVDHPSGNTANLFQNGASFESSYNANLSDAGLGTYNYTLGDDDDAGNDFVGFLGDVIAYQGSFTGTERQQIETYLAIKYGVTIDQTSATNYLFSDGSTVIWNATTNSAYNNDIAGIGRDDASCFSQKQSASINSDDILTVGLGSVAVDNASNSNSFADDGDYLIWGNDNGSTNQANDNTSDLPSSLASRMERIWKVQDNGTVGNTELQFDLAGLGYSTADASGYSLLIGNTATMADATIVTGGTFNGDVLSFSGVDLTDGQFFTIGTSFETCGPGGVNANIALWLRGDLEVFSDAGTTPAVDGNDVQQWNDQSSPQDNGSESNLGGANPVEPTFETEEINFNPALRFSDPNSNNAAYIETTSNNVSGDMTLISVFKTGQVDGTAGDFVNSPALIGASETSSTADYGLGMENGTVWINANTGTGFDAETSSTYNDNLPHMALATRVQSSGAVAIFVDGASAATGTGVTTALTGPTSFGIGNHSDGDVQAQFAGDIAETIVFSTALTANERTRVESYLGIKYGITRDVASLPAAEQDYLAADGGIVWDYDGQGTTYYNDIFGIGRDDLSCFEQTQSKSENSDALVTFNLPLGFDTNDSYLLSGNDNAPIEEAPNNERPATINSRLNREWRVQESGTVGSIELTYDLSTITGPLGVGTNNLTQLRLMVDDDGDFSNGGTTLISPSAVNGTSNTATFDVDFTNGQYYTLGSIEVAALPITLISFEASVNNDNQVKLDWVTASEVNNAFYTIERSTNGVDFETVGRIDGAGNSDAILYYTYMDTRPLNGLSFYRLKQTDFSGEFDFSEIRSVRVTSKFESSYKAYPNPIQQGEMLRIAHTIERDQTLRLSVLNSKGQLIFRKEEQALVTEKYIEVPTRNFQKGLNLIRILDENQQVAIVKVIVQ
ncbi:hypothetical protein BFP97_14040 [Roseivirga sp. 4D4]|uniref:hypothetical protein n=1 Tax=Roseivirga sp. 4D4 TaxID=1889784 RepID=UPI0008535DBF|nr:hypothetical protein [Roseivirga sp. 4D4]OEK02574.1 hypothetical protein BFP97_14040 [Roseivirga sp. 4D4]